MKRIIAIVLVAMFGFAFGCGGAQPEVEAPDQPEAEAPDVEEAVDEAPAEEATEEAPADEAGDEGDAEEAEGEEPEAE
ncbi:MAG: hypothetical protein JRI55_41050 [Deltaproteobacteria bacterium]|jgi:hypothetical protein|nr:hypothetical protein [Deltaproteobacteria bacterium]